MCADDQPDPQAALRNWTESPLPLAQKLAVAARNNLIKALRRQRCCGHHGEPGC